MVVQSKTRGLTLCGLFAALIAVGAFIRIPIPGVPFTLQFLFVNLAGLLLGSRLGATAVGTYVALGLIGLPVFTGGGGIGYVMQPTFGYLLGFILGAWIAGRVVERAKEVTFKVGMVAGLMNLFIVYVAGMVHYYLIMNFYLRTPVGLGVVFLYCFVLAVPGDLLLCLLSAMMCNRLRRVVVRGA